MKNIIEIYKTIGHEKKKLKLFIFFIFTSALLEIVGVALVVPVLTLILSSNNFISFQIPLFTENLITLQKDQLILITVSFIFFFYLFKSIFISYFNYWRSKFVFTLNKTMSEKLFTNYLYQPFIFHVLRNSSVSTRNLISVQNYVKNIDQCAHLVTEIIILLSFFLVLLFYEPLVTVLISLICFIFGFLYTHKVSPINFRLGKLSHVATKNILKSISQSLTGIKDIKLYGREKDFIKSFNKNMAKFSDSLTIFEFLQPLPKILLEFLAVILILTTVLFLYFLEYQNNDIIIFVALLAVIGFKLIPSVNKVLIAAQHLKYYLPLSKNIFKELNLKIIENSKADKKLIFKNNISINSLDYSYGNNQVLKDIRINIKKNSSIGIVGKTG